MKLNLKKILPSRADDSKSSADKKPLKSGGSMKISTKIFALVGLCLALLGLVAGSGAWQMNKIKVEIEGIAERDLPLRAGLTQITIHQLEQAVNFERAIRTGEEMKEHPASSIQGRV
jgi:hypothetical protein